MKKESSTKPIIALAYFHRYGWIAPALGCTALYYGIFYSKADNKCAVVGGSFLKLEPENNGYRWKESDGDNEYYVEPLGNHFLKCVQTAQAYIFGSDLNLCSIRMI